MSETPESFGEAPPASEAPDKIYLPPPADHAPPSGRKGRKGRHFGPRPVADPRRAWLTGRTTPEFLATVRADAKAAGLSLTDYMHVKLGGSRSPRARRTLTIETTALAQLAAQMGKPGSNLNQGARALNQIKLAAVIDGASRDRLAELIDDMAQLHRQAIAEHRECLAAIMHLLGMRPDDAGPH
jgi:hypothetical protein